MAHVFPNLTHDGRIMTQRCPTFKPRLVGTLLVLALASCCAHGGDAEPAKAWNAVIAEKLQKKLTLELDESSFDDALNFFRNASGVTMITDPLLIADDMPNTNLHLADT